MTMFEFAGRLLIVDCGMLLGKTNSPGVDLTLPDWSYFRDRLGEIDAIVLTHGHEDHIGALPYLLRERADVPIIGSRLTLALVAAKLDQHKIRPDLRRVREGETSALARGGCSSSPSTTRSRTRWPWRSGPAGNTILHTGDFKMDQTPLDGRLTDLPGFSRLGDEGVDLLLSDSTNAEVPRVHPVRARRRQGRHRRDHQGAGTHHRRLLRLARAPRAAGARRGRGERRGTSALVGRSMVRNMQIARDLGLLQVPDGAAGRPQDGRGAAVAPGPADLDRLAGRAAVGAVPDGQPRAPDGPDRPPTTRSCSRRRSSPATRRRSGKVINGLSRLGRDRRGQVDGAGARVRATRRPANCATCSTRCVPATTCRCTASGGTCAPTRDRALDGHPRRADHAGRGRHRGRPRRRGRLDRRHDPGRLRLRRRPGGRRHRRRHPEGPPHPRRGRLPVDPRRGRSARLARSCSARRSRPAVSPTTPPRLDPIRAELIEMVEKALADGTRDADALQHMVRRTVGRWVDREYRRRPMLVPHGRRGLSVPRSPAALSHPLPLIKRAPRVDSRQNRLS